VGGDEKLDHITFKFSSNLSLYEFEYLIHYSMPSYKNLQPYTKNLGKTFFPFWNF
jgi:hypothetical protein